MLYVVNAICVVETVISSLYWVHKRCADGFSCRAMPGQPIQAIRTTALIHHSPPPKVQSSRLFPSFGFLHCIRVLSLFMCQPLVYVPSLLVSIWFVRMQRHECCIRCRRKVSVSQNAVLCGSTLRRFTSKYRNLAVFPSGRLWLNNSWHHLPLFSYDG